MKTRSDSDQNRRTMNILGRVQKLTLTIIALVTFSTLSRVQGQLIGLDFGSSFIKGTLVQPGQPFSIIENTASARKTENMLTIGSENRLYGKDSFLESGKYPLTTFADLLRIFGEKFDEDAMAKFKEERLITNDFVADPRGNTAFRIVRKKVGEEAEDQEEVLSAEEILGTIIRQFRYYAEKMSDGQSISSGVITVPSWFSYDQRALLRDAAEGLGGFNVQQLVHENVAAATMFGIDQKLEANKTLTVLFYNMGGMDAEATVVRYSLVDIPNKKTAPYIEILAEASRKDIGATDVDLALTRLLAEKFDALPEREGQPSVLTNVRATKRLQKEAVKIKEVLSANKQSSVKIPELLNDVTLKVVIQRTELDEAAKSVYERVAEPALEALTKAGLKSSEIDQIELIGGGVRIPKVLEMLEAALERKDLGVHLNGDEAMCFGSAFIASNSSTSFKVKSVLLTQHPEFDVHLKISPTKPEEAMSEDDQKAEGLEEADIIKYNQEIRLFNHQKDYLGKSKGLSMNYNRDMTLEFFRVTMSDDGEEQLDLIDTFYLDDVQKEYDTELKHQVDEYKSNKTKAKKAEQKEAAKKKKEEEKKAKEEAAKDGSESEDDKTEEKEEKKEKKKDEEKKEEDSKAEESPDDYQATKPKLKLSVEFSRSGYLQITKSTVGAKVDSLDFKYDHARSLNIKQVRRDSQLSEPQMKIAKNRMKWYKDRDEDKIKTDEAKNEFESLVYQFRSWLREEDNEPYVEEEQRESWIEKLNEMEDWLYEDGSDESYPAYRKKREELDKDFRVFQKRESFDKEQSKTVESSKKVLTKIIDKIAEMKDAKPWIAEEEKQDILDRVEEARQWMEEELAKQAELQKHDDPVFSITLLADKMKKLQKLFKKVSQKPKPKEKKEKKEEKEEFGDGDEEKKKKENDEKKQKEEEKAKKEESNGDDEYTDDEEQTKEEETKEEETKDEEEKTEDL